MWAWERIHVRCLERLRTWWDYLASWADLPRSRGPRVHIFHLNNFSIVFDVLLIFLSQVRKIAFTGAKGVTHAGVLQRQIGRDVSRWIHMAAVLCQNPASQPNIGSGDWIVVFRGLVDKLHSGWMALPRWSAEAVWSPSLRAIIMSPVVALHGIDCLIALPLPMGNASCLPDCDVGSASTLHGDRNTTTRSNAGRRSVYGVVSGYHNTFHHTSAV